MPDRKRYVRSRRWFIERTRVMLGPLYSGEVSFYRAYGLTKYGWLELDIYPDAPEADIIYQRTPRARALRTARRLVGTHIDMRRMVTRRILPAYYVPESEVYSGELICEYIATHPGQEVSDGGDGGGVPPPRYIKK